MICAQSADILSANAALKLVMNKEVAHEQRSWDLIIEY